jgi:hypothetical protein
MKPTNPLSLLDIKTAMKDDAFVAKLPESLAQDVAKVRSNINCGCNMKFFERLIAEAPNVLQEYFPDKNIVKIENQVKEANQEAQQQNVVQQNNVPKIINNWTVISCHISELEGRLQAFREGRKQVTISRYEDQVTAIINHLDILQ